MKPTCPLMSSYGGITSCTESCALFQKYNNVNTCAINIIATQTTEIKNKLDLLYNNRPKR